MQNYWRKVSPFSMEFFFIHFQKNFLNIWCYFLTLRGWNNSTNSQTYKYSNVQFYFISYFTSIMRIGNEKFSPCEKNFACQPEAATDCNSLIQIVHHMLFGVSKLPNFYYKHVSTVLEAGSSHLALVTGRKLSNNASFQDESN